MNLAAGLRRGICVEGRCVAAGVVLCGFLGLVGCGSSSGGNGGGGSTTGAPLASGGATDVYVVQSSTSGVAQSILDFAADTNGSVTPKATITPLAGYEFESIATDSAGELYVGVASNGGNGSPLYEVLVYAAGATGQAVPVRTILLPDTGDSSFLPLQMTVSNGKLYVLGPNTVGVFEADGSSNVLAESAFSLPSGSEPLGIAADAQGNVYIATALQSSTTMGEILAYAAGASGSVLPTKTITTQGIPYGVAVDANGNVYTSLNTATLNGAGQPTNSTNQLVEYSGLTSGSLAVVKTIAGAATGVNFATGPQIDEVGNLYLVSVATKGTGSNFSETSEVVGFAPTATGNVAPGVVLSSDDWTESGDQLALH
jgi:hypothetical protein